jgi:hypothetical protein
LAKIIDFFDGAQSSTAPIIGDIEGVSIVVEPRVITALEESTKQLTLGSTPSVPSKVVFLHSEGPVQVYALDFTVSGTTLSWNGLGLDGILNENDNIVLMYNI